MACPPIAKLQSICLRLKDALNRRRYSEGDLKRRSLKISSPYNFQHIMQGSPNNMNEDEKESVRDTNLLIRRRMNILLRKTAATRMIPIEDQQQQQHTAPNTRPPSSSTTHSFFNTNTLTNTSNPGSLAQTTSCSRPKTPMKTRAGYRGLVASSSAANGGRGLAYAGHSSTRSFAAALEDGCGGGDGGGEDLPSTSSTHSFAASSPSEGAPSPTRHEFRGMSI